MSKAVVEEIIKNDLVKQAVSIIPLMMHRLGLIVFQARVGNILYTALEELAAKHPLQIDNLRGKGQG